MNSQTCKIIFHYSSVTGVHPETPRQAGLQQGGHGKHMARIFKASWREPRCLKLRISQ